MEEEILNEYIPKKPSPSRSSSGSEISALTPQTIVVFPIRTSADPLAVEIEPNLLIHRKKKNIIRTRQKKNKGDCFSPSF